MDKLSVGSIDQIVKCVAIRQRNQLSVLAFDFAVDEYRYLIGIPVVGIVWCVLKVPAHLAGRRIQRQQ